MARNYAALPHEYLREMGCLGDAEFGRLCRALLEYSANGTPIALNGNERYYAERVMMQEDRFKESYDEIADKRSEAGKAGAAARWQNDGKNGKRILPMRTDGKNGNTETNTETKTNYLATTVADKRAKFAPPTVEQVAEYCLERKNGVDAARFVDFYASKGWKVGKEPMKDWKAAVRNWERREKEEKTPMGRNGDKAWEYV